MERRVLRYCQATITNNHIIHSTPSKGSRSRSNSQGSGYDGRSSNASENDQNSDDNNPVVMEIKRRARVYKPVIILPELNHMQMAMGFLPEVSIKTGRADFTSQESLSRAHAIITNVVVDFMRIHSTPPAPSQSTTSTNLGAATREAEDRILKLGKTTQTAYLEPWLRLSDPAYQSRFLTEVQRQVLHVTVEGNKPFHFYEDEDDADEASVDETKLLPDIIPHWNVQLYDFLYSRPRWRPQRDEISMEVLEQDPISISIVPQISKTLAFKGRSQEEIILATPSGKYQEVKDSPAPTLMELNRQTFERVLYHCVTPQQQRRYLKEGKKLKFGPDILVLPSPRWVETPISITKHGKTTNSSSKSMDLDVGSGGTGGTDAYYLWQSTYTTTPLSYPAPYGGAWYGKPISPAQAYEWIVFDAFKPF